MPKKVITRRQRRAAEAKRQAKGNEHRSSTDPQIENMGARPVATLNNKPQQMSAGGVVTNKERKTIVPEAKIAQSEIMNKVTNIAPGLMPPPPSPATPVSEPVSFSKSLTRQAVATFNKIQKLSKAFNKKINHKQPTPKVADPTNSNGVQLDDNEGAHKLNQQCSCEFCKLVINQMLARKKHSNAKNCCKNLSKRPGNRRRPNTPPSRNVTPKAQQSEEGKLAPPSVIKRQRIVAMLEAKRKILKNNQSQNPKSSKMVKNEHLVKKKKPKTQMNEATQKDITPDAKQNTKSTQKDNNITPDQKPPNPKQLSRSATFNSKTKIIELKSAVEPKQKRSVKIDIQQQSEEPVDVPPAMILGNTGYFVLTGTDAQLAAQLEYLADKNVHVQETVLLQTGITDKLERQLKELLENRNQILQRMRDKENMEPRRTKYSKKQVKYK